MMPHGRTESVLLWITFLLFSSYDILATQLCVGCPPQIENLVIGIVNRALYEEHRNVFYSFYSDWVSELWKPENIVHIRYVELSKLPFFEPDPSDFQSADVYEVIYAQQGVVSIRAGHAVDTFLTSNPCWLPLLEPCGLDCGSQEHSASDATLPQYEKSLVLLRLPAFRFADTCKLYEHIVRRQFPSTCVYDSESMVSFALHNIGWSHTLHTMADAMMSTLSVRNTQKVFVSPYAEQYLGKDQSFQLFNGTVVNRPRSGWYWANEITCPTDSYMFNPWSCNFLSFSNCSNRDAVLKLPPDTRRIDKEADTTYLQKFLGITWDHRKEIMDAPLSDDRQWVEQRILSFLARPNAVMRNMIRVSLSKIRPLPRVAAPNAKTEGAHRLSQHFTKTTSKGRGGANRFSANRGYRSINPLQKSLVPCIAVHVRHGDSIYDSRNNNKTDRSFHAHVHALRSISDTLGTRLVYLLTDNATLPRYAGVSYPEYQWMMQVRPMRNRQRVFDVKNEKDIQLELAHLLADIIQAGSCAAVVGCFDSGVAVQVQKAVGDRSGYGQIHRDRAVNVLGNRLRGWLPMND